MDAVSVALAGLNAANTQFEQAVGGVVRATTPPSTSEAPAADVVELSAAMVEMMKSRTAVETNVKVVQTADQMDRTLLNIMG